MNTANEVALSEHEGISQVKESQNLFLKEFMENVLWVCP
jgi:hypothetical protein